MKTQDNARNVAAMLALALGLFVGASASTQNADNFPLVGFLRINSTETVEPGARLFRDAMAALGQVDGRNVRIEFRLAGGDVERFPELAEALVREKPSVILATGLSAILAAQHATSTIPIVADDDDLVAEGVVSNLARPNGNTTGISILATELDTKRLELLKEMLPSARRFAVLRDPANSVPARFQGVVDAAEVLGVELQTVDIHDASDLAPAFEFFRAGGVEAVNILASPILFNLRVDLIRLSLSQRLPGIWSDPARARRDACLSCRQDAEGSSPG